MAKLILEAKFTEPKATLLHEDPSPVITIIVMVNIGFTGHCYGEQETDWEFFFCPGKVCYEPRPPVLSPWSLSLFKGRAEEGGKSRRRFSPTRPDPTPPGSLGGNAEMPLFMYRSSFSLLRRRGLEETNWK